MAHKVVFAPEAQTDLLDLYDYIAEHGSPDRAIAYIARIETLCRGLATFPERGTRPDEIRPGLRVVGFARRVAVAFHVNGDVVTSDRVLYGGRDIGATIGS